jgi:hypothetical protein
MDKYDKYFSIALHTSLFLSILLLFFAGNLYLIPSIRFSVYHSALSDNHEDKISDNHENERIESSDAELRKLKQKAEQLKSRIDRLASPGNAYLIINTSDNTFRLYRRHKLVSSGLCSTGSFIHLEADSSRHWVFETPKGVLTVKNKITDPVWHKPDWAFIEEGQNPPPPDHPSRYEKGVLGDYALDLGNGYLIHGTLYQRFLGMSVTHGCIRLNDEDLLHIYNTLPTGSKVYIY